MIRKNIHKLLICNAHVAESRYSNFGKLILVICTQAVLEAVILAAILGCSPSPPPPTPGEKLQAEVRDLENSVCAGEYTLRESAIEIQQKRDNIKYEVAKAINEARAYGMDVETVRTQKVAELTDDLKIDIELHKVQMQMLQEDCTKLEQKRKELQQLARRDAVTRAPQQ